MFENLWCYFSFVAVISYHEVMSLFLFAIVKWLTIQLFIHFLIKQHVFTDLYNNLYMVYSSMAFKLITPLASSIVAVY